MSDFDYSRGMTTLTHRSHETPPSHSSLRCFWQQWKLIRYPLVDQTQLFDLQADPRELSNLAGKPEHAAKVAKVATMTALLEKEMAAHADVAPLKVANPKPAAWTPPAPGAKAGKKARKQADK